MEYSCIGITKELVNCVKLNILKWNHLTTYELVLGVYSLIRIKHKKERKNGDFRKYIGYLQID
jgi:hypothetical protein